MDAEKIFCYRQHVKLQNQKNFRKLNLKENFRIVSPIEMISQILFSNILGSYRSHQKFTLKLIYKIPKRFSTTAWGWQMVSENSGLP